MYKITKEEAMSLLQKLRQIRQAAGEVIAFLEHLMQLQEATELKSVDYNPDEYLEKLIAYQNQGKDNETMDEMSARFKNKEGSSNGDA